MSEKRQPQDKLKSMVAIYDFELFPYALGDVLTWNIKTAIRCKEMMRDNVDIYICLDERYPSGIFQQSLINHENYELFFSELYTSFFTHPCLRNIHIYRNREDLVNNLLEQTKEDKEIALEIDEYLTILEFSSKFKEQNKFISKIRDILKPYKEAIKTAVPKIFREQFNNLAMPAAKKINSYFEEKVSSHSQINNFYYKYGSIPLLKSSFGCDVDIEQLIFHKYKNKFIVAFHMRLRRLDIGYGGETSYHRDSDFLEWYDFINSAREHFPNVEFIALGRLQEKPLEMLSLPNVTSLRTYGMGLGHELTLINRANLFIGSSSGFAAYANFSNTPYFITKMNIDACEAYEIKYGSTSLPFAHPNQELLYEEETSELLTSLLIKGLSFGGVIEVDAPSRQSNEGQSHNGMIDEHAWRKAIQNPFNASATTSRFWNNDIGYKDGETAFLLMPAIERIASLIKDGRKSEAKILAYKLERNFQKLCKRISKFSENMDLIEK